MTIREVSEKVNLTQDTLRYYEKIGLILPVKRNAAGVRDYQEADLRSIEFIKCMRSVGLPIEALVRYMDLCRQGDDTIAERKAILEEQRMQLIDRMEKLKNTLEKLDYKIEIYENNILENEKELEKGTDE